MVSDKTNTPNICVLLHFFLLGRKENISGRLDMTSDVHWLDNALKGAYCRFNSCIMSHLLLLD